VERIADLLDPVHRALGAQGKSDLSAGLKEDLLHFNQYVSLAP
jgi:hypothetical protein